jgi:2,4-dienoyl-CoA reductase-like NADH-dependent reductase (Old Yellow Enzyme family)
MVPGILATPADYFSIGPVFATRTKQTSSPLIGMEGVRRLRAEAGPGPVLVAIGGITLATAAEALAAGATLVAIAGALFRQPDPAAEFRRWMTWFVGWVERECPEFHTCRGTNSYNRVKCPEFGHFEKKKDNRAQIR